MTKPNPPPRTNRSTGAAMREMWHTFHELDGTYHEAITEAHGALQQLLVLTGRQAELDDDVTRWNEALQEATPESLEREQAGATAAWNARRVCRHKHIAAKMEMLTAQAKVSLAESRLRHFCETGGLLPGIP